MISVASSRNELWSSMFDAIICGKCNMQHARRNPNTQHAARNCHVHHATCRSHDAECSATQSRGRTRLRPCGDAWHGLHARAQDHSPRSSCRGSAPQPEWHNHGQQTCDKHHTTCDNTTRNTRKQPHATRDNNLTAQHATAKPQHAALQQQRACDMRMTHALPLVLEVL